jgi:prophage DNA circulation protein
MASFLTTASYGGVEFYVASMSGKAGRDIVVKSPSRGDAHVLQDRGLRHRTLQCELMFVDEPGRATKLDRFLEFQRLANDGTPQIFRHPIDGSFRARVTDFDYNIRADDHGISASCTFLADDEPATVVSSGIGTAPLAGVEEVAATVAVLDESLAAENLSSATPQNTLDKVTAWTQAETTDTRAVYLEASSLSNQISDEINRLELVTNLDRWPLYREFINLNFQVRRAAEAATTEADDVFEIVVSSAQPLRALCARLYGAEEAEDKTRQATQINRLRTPGLVPAGTRLMMPREGAR